MLLDSNIIIYATEPEYDMVRSFLAQQQLPIISIISKIEVLGYHQLTRDKQQKLELFFNSFPILPLSDTINVFRRCLNWCNCINS